MDAIENLNEPRADGARAMLQPWQRDPRQIQMGILEELTLIRKATDSLALTLAYLTTEEGMAAVRAGQKRLLDEVKRGS